MRQGKFAYYRQLILKKCELERQYLIKRNFGDVENRMRENLTLKYSFFYGKYKGIICTVKIPRSSFYKVLVMMEEVGLLVAIRYSKKHYFLTKLGIKEMKKLDPFTNEFRMNEF